MNSPAASPATAERPQARPLLGMGLSDLEAWACEQGQPAFRGRQLHDWVYAKGARDLGAVTVLPKAWREQLLAAAPGGGAGLIGRLPLLHRSDAADGTVKLLLGTVDGLSIETVGIPSADRLTVCVRLVAGSQQAPGGDLCGRRVRISRLLSTTGRTWRHGHVAGDKIHRLLRRVRTCVHWPSSGAPRKT